MSVRWVNIYPLMNPDCYDSTVKSAWINSTEIKELILSKEANNWIIELHSPKSIEYKEVFTTEEKAMEVWEKLKDAFGIKRPYRKGPNKRYYERKGKL